MHIDSCNHDSLRTFALSFVRVKSLNGSYYLVLYSRVVWRGRVSTHSWVLRWFDLLPVRMSGTLRREAWDLLMASRMLTGDNVVAGVREVRRTETCSWRASQGSAPRISLVLLCGLPLGSYHCPVAVLLRKRSRPSSLAALGRSISPSSEPG
jgi:hypothetical protein